MCHRMSPLTFAELEQALDELRRTGHARVPSRDDSTAVPDAYPGRDVPLFVPDQDGNLVPAQLKWGFPSPHSAGKVVFNTRIETAMSQGQVGQGLWADPIRYGRCLVPVRSFYERWTVPGRDGSDEPHGDGQVEFTLAGHRFFLLACVRDQEHFSVVTCRPNAAVAPVHDRMPLVLGPGESRVWLGPDFATLTDRSAIRLESRVEEKAPQAV